MAQVPSPSKQSAPQSPKIKNWWPQMVIEGDAPYCPPGKRFSIHTCFPNMVEDIGTSLSAIVHLL